MSDHIIGYSLISSSALPTADPLTIRAALVFAWFSSFFTCSQLGRLLTYGPCQLGQCRASWKIYYTVFCFRSLTISRVVQKAQTFIYFTQRLMQEVKHVFEIDPRKTQLANQ